MRPTNSGTSATATTASLADQTFNYVRSLEQKIRDLEGRSDANAIKKPVEILRSLQLLEVREQLERTANVQPSYKEA